MPVSALFDSESESESELESELESEGEWLLEISPMRLLNENVRIRVRCVVWYCVVLLCLDASSLLSLGGGKIMPMFPSSISESVGSVLSDASSVLYVSVERVKMSEIHFSCVFYGTVVVWRSRMRRMKDYAHVVVVVGIIVVSIIMIVII